MQMHPNQPGSPDLAAEIDRLANLPVAALRAAWQAEFRKAPPKGLWRDLLLRTLAWRLQEKALGGHDRATERLLRQHSREKGDTKLAGRLKTGRLYKHAAHSLRGANENADNPHLRHLFTDLANEWLRLAKFREENGHADLDKA